MTTRRRMLAMLAGVAFAGCRPGMRHSRTHGPATRIVSLAPSTTEALFAIGAGRCVVGRSRFSNFPPEVNHVQVVGDVQPDLERILQLAPDLVVGTSGAANDRLSQHLLAYGIESLFPSGDSWAAMESLIIELGRSTGHVGEARAVVTEIEARSSAVERSVQGKPRPRVIYVINLVPVVVAGVSSFLEELVVRAGGTNVIDEGPPWPTLEFERIAALDPDIVLDGVSAGVLGRSAIAGDSEGWGRIRAVRQGHVVGASDDRLLRPGPRMAEGVELLAVMLHS